MLSQLKAHDKLRDSGGTTPKTFFGWAALDLATLLKGVNTMHGNLKCADVDSVLYLSNHSTLNLEYPVYQVLPV